LTRAQRSEGCVAGDCVEAGNVASLNLGGIGAQPIQNFRQASAYAAKRYIAKADLPDEIRDTLGRFWGRMCRDNVPLGQREVLRISPGDACQLRRLVRRYRRSTSKPEKRRFLRSAQFRDPEFSVTTFLDVEQWYRWITPMPVHFPGAIQESQQVLASNPSNPVQPELFGANQARQFPGTMQQADEQETVGARLVKHDVVPKPRNAPPANLGNAGKSGQSTGLWIPG